MRKSLLFIPALVIAPLLVVAACTEEVVAPATDSGAPTSTLSPTQPAPTNVDPPAPPIQDASKADRAVAPEVRARIEAYDTALSKAICGKVSTCCSDADLERYTSQFKEAPYKIATPITPQNCETVLKQAFDALNVQKWGVSASVGNIVFEDAKGAACVAKVNAAACGVPLTTALFDGTCFGLRGNEVFRKTAVVGAACDDIGDGTFIGECDPAFGYCGEQKRCTAWRKSGETCGLLIKDSGPAERLFCAPGTNCDGQTLRNPGKCSGPAQNVALGASCAANTGPDLNCPATAYCEILGNGLCQEKRPNGAACQYDEECVDTRPFSCYAAPVVDGGAGDASDGAAPARTCGSTSYCGGRQ